VHPSDPGYWRTRQREAPAWPATDPIPEVLSTDPSTPPIPEPRAVVALKLAAAGAGWTVRVGYARGPARAVKVGTYKMVESFGMWSAPHAVTGLRFRAVYAHTVGVKAWAWDIALWLPGQPRFLDATVTDLIHWLRVFGDVGLPWYKAVSARVADQKARAKQRTSKPKEGSS